MVADERVNGGRTDGTYQVGEAMNAQSPSVCACNQSIGPGVWHVPPTHVIRLLNLGQRDTHFHPYESLTR